jgi:lipopolysaccharide export system permease protein
MIFHRALLREFASLAGAVFMALFAIALTTQLIRLLGKAAGGSIPTDAVLAFLGFFALGALPVLLSLTMFISVLMTLTRGWRDSEMVIWFGSGLPLTAWLKPVMLFALPQIAVIAALSLFISPWAAQMAGQYASKLETRDDVSRVTPGVFGETANKERVFFVESVSGHTNEVQNVFVSSVQQGKGGVSMSRSGRTETAANGDRFIVLEQGRRYEGSPGDEQYRVTEFDRYAARIESRESAEPERNQKNLSTWALMSNPTKENLAELVWRIGIPLSSFVLVLLAIPMSFVNPRAGRSANLLFALLTYMVYSNLLSVSQARVAQGRLDFSLGIWLVHAAMVLLLVVLFAQRMQLIKLRLGK